MVPETASELKAEMPPEANTIAVPLRVAPFKVALTWAAELGTRFPTRSSTFTLKVDSEVRLATLIAVALTLN